MKSVFVRYFLISLLSALLIPLSSFANEKDQEVKKFVEQVGNDVVAIAKDNKLSDAKKKDKIITLIDSVVDDQWIARFVLGKNYKNFSQAQKDQFLQLYHQFMINTYAPKFNGYNGKSFAVKEVEKQSLFYLARSEFMPAGSNQPILIDFRVKDKNDKLVIVDFVAEGISLIETQRSEFNSAISEKGIEGFLGDFAKKVENLKSGKLSKN